MTAESTVFAARGSADDDAMARSIAAFTILLHHYTGESHFTIRAGEATIDLDAAGETRVAELLTAARTAALPESARPWELCWAEEAGNDGEGAILSLSVDALSGHIDEAGCVQRGMLAVPDPAGSVAAHYRAALAATASLDATVGQISLLSPDERALLTRWFSHTALVPELEAPRLLHRLFEAQAERRPDHPAIEDRGRSISYRELNRLASRLADGLQARGIGPGHFVAFQLPRSVDVYVAILGILKAGAAYVPLDPEYPVDRVDYILSDCKVSLLLTTSTLCPSPMARSVPVAFLDGDWQRALPVSVGTPPSAVSPDDICYVIYTSGSTGKPKGVALEHRNVAHLVLVEQDLYGVSEDDRIFQGFSIAFDAAVEEVWSAFAAGATLVVGTKEDMLGDLAGRLTRAGITFFSTVPTLLASVMEDLPTVRILILGGEACPQALVERWATPARRMFNTYGPTEATVIATSVELKPGDKVTIGRPITNYFTYVTNPAGELTPAGVPGELCIGGPGVAREYVGRPELTASRFVANPFTDTPHAPLRLYRTGDRVRYDAVGNIEFLGRLDDQVKLRGFRIELGEIENALTACGGIGQVVAVVRKDTPTGQQLVAYVVPASNEPPVEERLKEALRAHLPPYMIPAYIEVMAALPTLTSGKVDRKALPAPAARTADVTRKTGDAPSTAEEHAVAACFASLLGLTQIGRDEDFFDLGGHSMLVAQAVSRLRRQPAFETMSVVDVYSAPTVAKLAARLAARTTQSAVVGTSAPPASVSSTGYALCGLAQLFFLYFVFGLYGLQWEGPYLAYGWLRHQDVTQPVSLLLTALALVAVYPATLLVAVAAKWLIVGRYRAGRHRLWGWYYLRWWVMDRLLGIIPVGILAGTPLLNWYYRLLGARIGKNVLIASASLGSFDLIDIGDDTTIDLGADLSGDAVENGMLVLGRTQVGKGCHVGVRAVLADGSTMGDGASLGTLSALPRGAVVPSGEHWEGCPARGIGQRPVAEVGERPVWWRLAGFSVAAAAGGFLLPLLVLLAISPGMLVLNHLYRVGGGHAWYLLVAPLVALSFIVLFCLEVAVLKWLLLGRIREGSYQVYSADYFRKWLFDQAMEASLDLIGSLYATSFLKAWYTILGVKLGPNCEVSTATGFAPDLLDIGEGAFLADCVSIGAPHTDRNRVHLKATKVGRRTFIGNSGVVLGGTTVGDECLLGCLSACPADDARSARAGSVWLGSPAMSLPTRQESPAFPDEVTYRPSLALSLQRYTVELFRVVLPTTGFVVNTCLLITTLIQLSHWFSLPFVALLFPLLYAGFGACAALAVIAAKWLLIGRFKPTEKPLFDSFVWRTELVNALHEYLVNPCFVELLEGTPFAAWFFRALGMRIGRRVYLATTEFTEYDLLEIGDGACLNNDCTLQTHLFEDRVMKMSRVHVGAGCTIGRDAIVLYDATMEDGSSLGSLSLLMKGETLPARSHWEGCPAMAVSS